MNLLKRTAAALAATVGIVAMPVAAHAGTIVEYSTDGTNWFTICSSASSTCSGSASALSGQLTITVAGVTQSASASSSDIFTAATQISFTGAGVTDVILRYAGDGFTTPTSGTLLSNLGGTGINNTSPLNTVAFTSCVVNANIGTNPGSPHLSDVPCPGGISTPTLSPAVNVASFSGSTSTSVSSVGTPYLLAQNLDVHIVSGATLNFANSTDLVAAPEPSSIVLTASGLIGLVGFARRRKNQA
jgi:hypothetical protein